jgi:hypothetical protein
MPSVRIDRIFVLFVSFVVVIFSFEYPRLRTQFDHEEHEGLEDKAEVLAIPNAKWPFELRLV